MQNYAQTNLQTAAYRLDQRRPQPKCEYCEARGEYRKIIRDGNRYGNVTVCGQHRGEGN